MKVSKFPLMTRIKREKSRGDMSNPIRKFLALSANFRKPIKHKKADRKTLTPLWMLINQSVFLLLRYFYIHLKTFKILQS